MSSDKLTASVIILTYNSEDDIVACLRSLLSDDSPDKEILVIDNASTDKSVDVVQRMFPQVRLIQNRVNRGVAAGWNQGIRETTGDLVVVMNPDVEVSPDWLEKIRIALKANPSADVAGIKLLYPDGTIQHGGLFFHANAQSYHRAAHEADRGQVDAVEAIEAVTGAVFAARRKAWESLGGFDEDYFPAYFEEADFCFRIRKMGREVLYVGDASAIHHEASTLGASSASYLRLYFRMRALYILKNYSLKYIVMRSIPVEVRLMCGWPWTHRYYALISWVWAFPYVVRRIWNKFLGRSGRLYGRRARRQGGQLQG